MRLGGTYSIHDQPWPSAHEETSIVTHIELPVQINGRVRDRITILAHANEDEIRTVALSSDVVKEVLSERDIQKVVVVPYGKAVTTGQQANA